MTESTHQRETDDVQVIDVVVHGVAVTTGVLFSVVPDGQRPGTYTAAVPKGSAIGVRVFGLTPGAWRVFANVSGVVIDCGYFRVV